MATGGGNEEKKEEEENPYEILGVAADASEADIRTAYLQLCRVHHPDKAKTEEQVQLNTVMMFKLNQARDLLLDPERRRDYDAWRQRGDSASSGTDQQQEKKPSASSSSSSKGPKQEQYEDYKRKQARQRPPRPSAKPTDVGSPYKGPLKGSKPFFYDGNGQTGTPGEHGQNGIHGQMPGDAGENGYNGQTGGQGNHGADLKINLKTVFVKNPDSSSDDGDGKHFEVDVSMSKGNEVMDPNQSYDRFVPLKIFEKVDWTAKGGDGGPGGNGGNGGNGKQGKDGRDASRGSPGTNGERGGDGGNGGLGANGGDGGRGGQVEVLVSDTDSYLLMRVGGCHPNMDEGNNTRRLVGGKGGNPGHHGTFGKAALGGAGGKSHKYQTSHEEERGENKRIVTKDHIEKGGSKGPKGKDGKAPKDPLQPGKDGPHGTFQIRLQRSEDGSTSLHDARYDLAFVSTMTKELSDMRAPKTYEFGETVLITGMKVKNTGKMPTPRQRIMFAIEQTQGVRLQNPLDRLFLSRDGQISAGHVGTAEEAFLRFTCPIPDENKLLDKTSSTDFDPIHHDAWLRYGAYQLGPENKSDQPNEISDFIVKYKGFHETSTGETIHMTYPIENRDGVHGITSLGMNETTILQLKLLNTSNQSFGEQSGTERRFYVQIYYADDQQYEIPLEYVTVRGDDGGRIVDVNPAKVPKGYRKNITYLPANGETTVQLSVRLNLGSEKAFLRPSSRAALQFDICLQDIPTLLPDGSYKVNTVDRIIQRRIFVASYQPKFQESGDAHVVLVTTTATKAEQVDAWRYLVEERLGLVLDVYSLSRYGHLDASQVVEEKNLLESFRNKTVIVLNEPYLARPNEENERKQVVRPSLLLNSPYDFDSSTDFLIVGGDSSTVHHLSPLETGVNTVLAQASATSHRSTSVPAKTVLKEEVSHHRVANRKTYLHEVAEALAKEHEKGFTSERVRPTCFEIVVKTKAVRKPKPAMMARIVEARAKSTAKWLEKKDLLRPYHVEWANLPEPKLKEEGVVKLWEIGELRIYVGTPRFQSAVTTVGDEREGENPQTSWFTSPESIRSRSMLFAVVNAVPFSTKIACFERSARALAKNMVTESSEEHTEVCQVVIDCCLNEFVWDVSNYWDGSLHVEKVMNRSPVVRNLMTNEILIQLVDEAISNEALKQVLSVHLSSLVVGMICAAESKDLRPWWNPFSRKYAVCKEMKEAVGLLEESWKHVLLDEKSMRLQRREIEEKVQHHIKKTRKKVNAHAQTQGRWRDGLSHVYSPTNEERYPHAAGFTSASTKISKHFEFDDVDTIAKERAVSGRRRSSTTGKKRAGSLRTVDPETTKQLHQSLEQRNTLRSSVLTNTVRDNTTYRIQEEAAAAEEDVEVAGTADGKDEKEQGTPKGREEEKPEDGHATREEGAKGDEDEEDEAKGGDSGREVAIPGEGEEDEIQIVSSKEEEEKAITNPGEPEQSLAKR